MKRITIILFALLVFLVKPSYAQVSNPSIIPVASAPSGACNITLPDRQVVVLGTVYTCQSGTWAQLSGGGGGGLPPDGTTIINNGGNLSTKSIKVENIFASGSTINYIHNLGDEYPLYKCFSRSGATAFTDAPVDANTISITTSAAADILCSFIATQALPPNFSFAVNPNTLAYIPTMTGTQTPTFAITQTGFFGYTGTATYSTTGLASGMSSSYSPTTITGSGSNTLSVSFPATQAAATTTFNASATDGVNTHTQPVSITISNINSGLQDGWQMNEGSGTTFNDATANANQQTFTGSIGSWGTATGIGTAYSFNGTGASTGSNDTLTNFPSTQPFSICSWFRPTQVTALAGILGAVSTTGYFLRTDTGSKLDFGLGVVSSAWIFAFSNTVLVANTTYFSCVTYDGTKLAAGVTFYINGVATTKTVTHDTLASSSTLSNLPVSIGKDDIGDTFQGAIGHVTIYNRVLSSGDVAAYYAAGPK